MDLAVVTTTDNNKASAKDYAYDFYDYNMFGKNKFHDGILFLIDMDTREIYFATSGEEQIMYDDERIDDILDVVYSYVKDEKYYDSIEKGIDKSSEFASSGIPSSNEDVRLDENGKPNRWKIENSWGDKVANQGYFIGSDTWFDKYMYVVAVNKKFLSKEALAALEKEPVQVAPWDPFGTLAD